MQVEFRVLGSVEALHEGAVIDVGPARQQCVLVALLADANRVVLSDHLVYRAWGDRAPPGARGTLRTYLSRLRQALAIDGSVQIGRRSGGYVITVDPLAVDLHRFHCLVAQSQTAPANEDALVLLGEALALWRGEAFAGLDTPWINTLRDSLEAARVTGESVRTDLRLDRGEHGALLAELTHRTQARPLDEQIAGQLMLALYRCGRQADALKHYEQIRSGLADELGTDPCPRLRELHKQILSAHPALAQPASISVVVPRQLPPPGTNLIGRDKLLDDITAVLCNVDDAVPPIVLLAGPGGVGKTALALAAAHRSARAFADGQLYADLRGNQDTRMDPHSTLGRFLRALGVDESRVPDDPDERIAMYRSHLAGKRILVMLDDAASEGQVRPLLTGGGGSATLITSRHQLGALVAVRRWTVPVLIASDAEDMFATVVGAQRVAGEPEAAVAIVRLCAYLPLAISIAAARLAVHPYWTLEEFRQHLATQRRRLDELSVGDLDVRASIALSYHALDSGARLLLRRLGLVNAPTWPAWIADRLAGADAASRLDRLTDAHLVEPMGRDTVGQSRFRLHDLVAEYATERALADDDPAERIGALSRLLSGWLARARQAPDDWFEAERGVLILAVDHACRLGLTDIAGELALCLSNFLSPRRYGQDAETVLSQAIPLIRKDGPRDLLPPLLSALFIASARRDRHAELPAIAAEELAQARLVGSPELEVRALEHAAIAASKRDQFAAALALAGQAATAARRHGVPRALLSDALATLALHQRMSGRRDHVLLLLEEATTLDRAKGADRRTALHLYHYGLALLEEDRASEAEKPLAEALVISRERGHTELAAYLDQVLADVAMRKGQFAVAADRLEVARCLHEQNGSGDGMAEALRSTGDLAAAEDRWPDAVTWLSRALHIWRSIESRIEIARTLARIERAHAALGAQQLAEAARTERQDILDTLGLDNACLYLPPFYVRDGPRLV